jgi:hypothetical protein
MQKQKQKQGGQGGPIQRGQGGQKQGGQQQQRGQSTNVHGFAGSTYFTVEMLVKDKSYLKKFYKTPEFKTMVLFITRKMVKMYEILKRKIPSLYAKTLGEDNISITQRFGTITVEQNFYKIVFTVEIKNSDISLKDVKRLIHCAFKAWLKTKYTNR